MADFHVFQPSPMLRGVLFADEFDPPQEARPESELAAVIAHVPVYTTEDLDAAIATARAESRSEALRDIAVEHQQLVAATLHAIGAKIEAAGNGIDQAVDAAAEALARVVLAILETLLPAAMARAAPEEIVQRTRQLLRSQFGGSDLQVQVAPGLAAEIRLAFADPAFGLEAVRVSSRPDLAQGEAEIIWEGGRLRRNDSQITAVLHDILAQLGLAQNADGFISPDRSQPWRDRHKKENTHAG
jgi:hypothetical protein